jgi:hypothetical protein
MIDFLLKKNNFIVFENLVDLNLQNKIENTLLYSFNFPWYYHDFTVDKKHKGEIKIKRCDINDYSQFTHNFYGLENSNIIKKSNFTSLVDDLLNNFNEKTKLNLKNILRIKSNLQTQHSCNTENTINYPHVDFDNIPHYVLIYYVNDSDGDTILIDENFNIFKRITPKKGNFLLFDGKILHTGSHPIKSNSRVIININLKK